MNKSIKNITLSSIFLAIGLFLPFLTGQIREIGNMLLPMHIPVFLCGLIVNEKYGALIGFILPILRSILFSMPMMFPSAIVMAFELMTYGFMIGYLWRNENKKTIPNLLKDMLVAMIMGRVIWSLVMFVISIETKTTLSLSLIITSTITTAIPGIILQFILIPTVIFALSKLKYIKLDD